MQNCGECQLCCKLLAVTEIKKPAGAWCEHCAVGEGCKIYERRPASCGEFACMWLLSDGWEDLRPDRSGVIFHHRAEHPERIEVHCDLHRPEAWDRGDAKKLVQAILAKGLDVLVIVGESRRELGRQ